MLSAKGVLNRHRSRRRGFRLLPFVVLVGVAFGHSGAVGADDGEPRQQATTVSPPSPKNFLVCAPPPRPTEPCVVKNQEAADKTLARPFITRSGDRLIDGSQPLRFVGFDAATLLIEDPWPQFDDDAATLKGQKWEQEELMKSLAQFAGGVTRTYVISTQGEFPPSPLWANRRKHVSWDAATGGMIFDPVLFEAMDRALELANLYGMRLIVPLVNDDRHPGYTESWGGAIGYSRAVGGGNFYTDARVKSEFGKLLCYIVNRVNQRTCVKYKDDPAILAWQTGNELHNPQEWAEYIAQTLKGADPNHLVMDGNYGVADGSLEESSAIDIVSNHYYGDHLNAGAVLEDRARARGRKPFIVGEFGTNDGGDPGRVRNFVDAVINSGTNGALFWTLRPHKRDGGFSFLCDAPSDLSCSLHWPGFPLGVHSRQFQHPNEKEIISLIADAASAIRGFPPGGDGRIGNPDPPELLSVHQYPLHLRRPPIFQLRWRGSAGADAYIVERALEPGGPWVQLTADASDNQPANRGISSMYDDGSFSAVNPFGKQYYYRVKAQFINGLGRRVSAPSNSVASPVASCLGPWRDSEICPPCGESQADPCGVVHGCPACPNCGGRPPCPDGICPQDHPGGRCVPKECPILRPVQCLDGSCRRHYLECPENLHP